jgi:hypothetical protein
MRGIKGDAKTGGDHLDEGAQGGCLKGFVTNRIDNAAGLEGVAVEAAVLHHEQLRAGKVVAVKAVASAEGLVAP